MSILAEFNPINQFFLSKKRSLLPPPPLRGRPQPLELLFLDRIVS
ncbi:hypothetical protein C789_4194 [Microcystis aeruginosa FACHB-905 = DIANCHI905]|nr:hypothetical protein C789_4194 [Microcystis aeruginosa FACHB-905 = DIANCHI905]